VGCGTTAPAGCLSVKAAREDGLDNYSILVANKTMPQAYEALKDSADVFLYPGHVNAITGTRLCEALTEEGVSGVVAGFTAKELMTALAVALVKFQEGKPFFVNCYPRVVTQDGSREAQLLVDEMMEACDCEWRGLGVIPKSGMKLRQEWQEFDARLKYQMPKIEGVVVVAQGGGNAKTVTEISNAVMSLFPVEAHKVVVVKMSVQEE